MMAPNLCLYIFPMHWKHMEFNSIDSSLMYNDVISTESCVLIWCFVALEFGLSYINDHVYVHICKQ